VRRHALVPCRVATCNAHNYSSRLTFYKNSVSMTRARDRSSSKQLSRWRSVLGGATFFGSRVIWDNPQRSLEMVSEREGAAFTFRGDSVNCYKDREQRSCLVEKRFIAVVTSTSAAIAKCVCYEGSTIASMANSCVSMNRYHIRQSSFLYLITRRMTFGVE